METLQVPRGIIRFEQGRTRGWWVRMQREGVNFRKLFSDSVYGSPENSLKEAIAHLEEIKAAIPRSRKLYSNSAKKGSGPIPGVRRVMSKRKGNPYWSWQASWSPEPGVYKHKKFGELKHGEQGAMKLAIAHRIAELSKIQDRFPEEYEKEMKEIPKEYINSGYFEYQLNSSISENEVALKEYHDFEPYAFEGHKNFALHTQIERSKKLRELKINKFLEKHGAIYCEICHVNMKNSYSFLKKDYIEVHHVVPLALLESASCTSLEDLVLLCPNCHSAVHQGDPQENLIEAMIQFGRDFE